MYSLIKAVTNQPLGVTYASNCERPWHVPQRQCDPFTRWLGCRNYSNQYRDRNNPINASRKGLACIVRFLKVDNMSFIRVLETLWCIGSIVFHGTGRYWDFRCFTVYMYVIHWGSYSILCIPSFFIAPGFVSVVYGSTQWQTRVFHCFICEMFSGVLYHIARYSSILYVCIHYLLQYEDDSHICDANMTGLSGRDFCDINYMHANIHFPLYSMFKYIELTVYLYSIIYIFTYAYVIRKDHWFPECITKLQTPCALICTGDSCNSKNNGRHLYKWHGYTAVVLLYVCFPNIDVPCIWKNV